MTPLEAGLRGGAVALLLLLAATAWRDGRRTANGRYGAFICASVAALTIVIAPDSANLPFVILFPLRLIAAGMPAAFWLWTWAHFDDEFEPSWAKFAPWAGLVVFAGATILTGNFILRYALNGLSLILLVLVVWRALSGLAADLVERRRRLRYILIGVTALYSLFGVVANTFFGTIPQGNPSLINAVAMLAIAIAFTFPRLHARADTSIVSQGQSANANSVSLFEPSPEPNLGPPDPQEETWLASLRRLMDDDKAYREEGLSITTLSDKLSLPEYRLRRLINQRMGYRNFSSFVNGYRLAEARAALADPTQAEVPILTIALDAGFQSIGPFNRAFKTLTGVTPSEFRRNSAGI